MISHGRAGGLVVVPPRLGSKKFVLPKELPALTPIRTKSAQTSLFDIDEFDRHLARMQTAPRSTLGQSKSLTALAAPKSFHPPNRIASTPGSKKRYDMQAVHDAVKRTGEPCPIARTAYLVTAYDGDRDGVLTGDELAQLIHDIHEHVPSSSGAPTSTADRLQRELRHVWRHVMAMQRESVTAKQARPAVDRPQEPETDAAHANEASSGDASAASPPPPPTAPVSLPSAAHRLPSSPSGHKTSVTFSGDVAGDGAPATIKPPHMPSSPVTIMQDPAVAAHEDREADGAATGTRSLEGRAHIEQLCAHVRHLVKHQSKRLLDVFRQWDRSKHAIARPAYQQPPHALCTTLSSPLRIRVSPLAFCHASGPRRPSLFWVWQMETMC